MIQGTTVFCSSFILFGHSRLSHPGLGSDNPRGRLPQNQQISQPPELPPLQMTMPKLHSGMPPSLSLLRSLKIWHFFYIFCSKGITIPITTTCAAPTSIESTLGLRGFNNCQCCAKDNNSWPVRYQMHQVHGLTTWRPEVLKQVYWK